MPSTDWHYELIGLLLAWADVFWRLFSVPLYAIYEFTGRDPTPWRTALSTCTRALAWSRCRRRSLCSGPRPWRSSTGARA